MEPAGPGAGYLWKPSDTGAGIFSNMAISRHRKMSIKNRNLFPKSLITSLNQTDYSQWEREEAPRRPKFTLLLPPTLPPGMRKDGKKFPQKIQPRKPEEQKVWSMAFRPTTSLRQKAGWHQTLSGDMAKAKSLENIRILQRLSKSKMTSLEELKHHSSVILEKNKELMEAIQETEADSASQARSLLQQYDMFGRIIATLRDSNQNQVGFAKAELKDVEKKVEKNMAKLDVELKRVGTRVHTLQEEVNILRTYMDKEYPLKAVQIASLLRAIRKLNEEQQYELEDTEDLAKRFLDSLVGKASKKQEHILQTVADQKTLLEYQDGLEQMYRNNAELRRQIKMKKELIDELQNDVKQLHSSIITLHHSAGDPYNVIFPDVLLRRPKCTPEMDVILNIPTDCDFPL